MNNPMFTLSRRSYSALKQLSTKNIHAHGLQRAFRFIHTTPRKCVIEKSRQTDLLKQLLARIRINGPLTLAEYMREVLTNPVGGYYMHRDVFGAKGDFTTSPEISQLFGEMIGIWFLHSWMGAGSPKEVQIVEIGPGRGTLADDMMRMFAQFPEFRDALTLHLVEISPKLSHMQREKLTGVESWRIDDISIHDEPAAFSQLGSRGASYMDCTSKYGPQVHWHSQLPDVPRKFSFYIAHEFLDALPIHAFKKKDGQWNEVLVDADTSPAGPHHLRHVLSKGETPSAKLLLPDVLHSDEKRDYIEVCPEGGVMAQELANRITLDGGFALLADYGHAGEKTDTFRGFKKHKLHDPLETPGEADLTADVDFSYLTRMVADRAEVHGPVTQRDFLHNMCIVPRLEVLLQKASNEERKDLISGYDMITNPSKMGERFKFMAMTRPQINKEPLAGFNPAGPE